MGGPVDAPRKPSYVFDRDVEWSSLRQFITSSDPDVRLGIVSGRRRQGKTFLLRALAEATQGFYFTATETTSTNALREFAAALAEHTRSGIAYRLDTWEDALRAVYQAVPQGLIVIDEFPYLVAAEPALPSLLQRALDPGGWIRSTSTAKLLLCGSAMAVMGKLLAGSAPLRGRAGMELLIRPFDYRAAAQFWGLEDTRLAILVNAIVGGTPAYRHAFVRGDTPASIEDFDAWVLRTVLNPDSPLFREARYLLSEEIGIREPAVYNSVLGAIAAGKTTRGAIATYVGRKDSDLAHTLNVLEDSGLIRRDVDPFHARKSVFRVVEPLIVFYESVMRRAWTPLEQHRSAAVWADAQARFRSQVVGPHFEALCREHIAQSGDQLFGGLVGDIAAGTMSDPAQRNQIELDVVALAPGLPGEHRTILCLGEAKWNVRMGIGHINRLRRAREVLAAKGFDTSSTALICYSGAGFSDELRAAAASAPASIMLIDPHQMYSAD
ncbi:MAG: AAA family ATPase [Mycobacteriales bacterium]